MLCFSSFNLSYADWITDTYLVLSNVTVRVGGSKKTKSCGRLNKGQKVKIIAAEKNSTGSWWCKISRSTNSKGKWVSTYKNKWIYAGATNFFYVCHTGLLYRVSSDYSSVNVRKSASSSSKKLGSLPKNTEVIFKDFKGDSRGNVWGQILDGYKYSNGWICMKYINFSGVFRSRPSNKRCMKVRKSLNSPPITVYAPPTQKDYKDYVIVDVKRIDLLNGEWLCSKYTVRGYDFRAYKYLYLDSLLSTFVTF